MENPATDSLHAEAHQDSKSDKKKSGKKKLQLERNRTAYERLLLSWVRTSLSLFVIGLTAFELYHTRITQGKEPLLRLINGRDIAVFLFTAAFVMLLLATIQHFKTMQTLKSFYPESRFSVAAILAYLLLLLIGKLLFNALISFY
jgi:uncharacterized membrane protein YidH (DUF202 family)